MPQWHQGLHKDIATIGLATSATNQKAQKKEMVALLRLCDMGTREDKNSPNDAQPPQQHHICRHSGIDNISGRPNPNAVTKIVL